jgi:hypothetical protein
VIPRSYDIERPDTGRGVRNPAGHRTNDKRQTSSGSPRGALVVLESTLVGFAQAVSAGGVGPGIEDVIRAHGAAH